MNKFKKENYFRKVCGIAALIIATTSYSEEAPLNENGVWEIKNAAYNITTNNERYIKISNEKEEYGLLEIEGSSKVDVEVPLRFNVEIERSADRDTNFDIIELRGLPDKAPELNAKDIDLKIFSKQDSVLIRPRGLDASDSSKINADNISLDIEGKIEDKGKDYEGDTLGILSFMDGGDIIKDENGKLKPEKFKIGNNLNFKNVDIKIKNSKNSDSEFIDYYLTGIKMFKPYEKAPNSTLTISENLNIEVSDVSTKQNANNLIGISVVGRDDKIVLNNSNIKLIGEKATWESSAAIAVGGMFVLGEEVIETRTTKDERVELREFVGNTRDNGLVESKGKMVLDTRLAPNAPAVYMRGIGSKLNANFENSSTDIKTGGIAIKFGERVEYEIDGIYKVYDPDNLDYEEDETDEDGNKMQIEGSNQIVDLKNANISTIYTGVGAENGRNNLIFVEEDVKNAQLNLSGEMTSVKAAEISDANLLYAEGASDITFNVKDSAKVEGKIDSVATNNKPAGIVRMNISNGGVWKLQNSSSKSNLRKLTLSQGAILDASNISNNEAYKLTTSHSLSDNTNEVNFINDGGIITTANNRYDDKLYIYGNYEGKNGALIKVNTLWNAPNSSESDKIYFENQVKGTTTVKAIGIDGSEDKIDGSVNEVAKKISTVSVIVAKNAEVNSFVGTAQTNGAGEAQLTSKLVNGKRQFFWTLNSNIDSDSDSDTDTNDNDVNDNNQESSSNTTNNNNSNLPNKPNTPFIYNQTVPAYVSLQKLNAEIGFLNIGTLNERKGEKQKILSDKKEIWSRIIGKNYKAKGENRFEINSNLSGIQVGYDFYKNFDSKVKNIFSVYFSNIKSNSKFYDRYRSENAQITKDKYTGKSQTDSFTLGFTNTKYYSNGFYIDLVGQVSKLENKYETRNNTKAKQKGKSLAFSVELGKNYKISNNLFIEPQVQGIYQYLKLNDFSDGTRNVKIDDKGIWRSRIGLRFSNNIPQSESLSFYGLLNLWNDFANSSKVKANIGKDKIKEKYSSTYAEIGVGLDVPLLNTLNIYADFKYQKDLKKKNNSYSGSFGIKYSL